MAKKRVKKKGKKKKPRPKKKSNGLNSVKIVSTKGISFVDVPHRESKYTLLYSRISQMKADQSILLNVPKGVDIQVYHNRINSALRKNMPKPPKGCSYEKRSTKNGKIAISCVRN